MAAPIRQRPTQIPEECQICYEPANTRIKHKDELANRVNHYFCNKCLGEWLFPVPRPIDWQPRTCPSCRGEIEAIHVLKNDVVIQVEEREAPGAAPATNSVCIKIGMFALGLGGLVAAGIGASLASNDSTIPLT